MMILMQGIPGSGKSTRAKELSSRFNATICSTDDYFLADGQYKFDVSKIALAHEWNQQRAFMLLANDVSIIVDNTNIKMEHMRPYVDAARQYGHDIFVCRCCGDFGSTHNVPQYIVERMRLEMESLPFSPIDWSYL